MSPLIARFLPYAGWPLAALMFWFWLGAKEDLAAQVERCNVEKLQAVVEAEAVVREELRLAQEQHELEKARLEERAGSLIGELEGEVASLTTSADELQNQIRTLMRDAANNENATVEEVCLNINVPATVVDGVR